MTLSQEILPGVPLVESPLFEQSIDAIGLTDIERGIAVQLHDHGYAVIDFPDVEIGLRMDRIKRRLGPTFGVDFDDPSAIKNSAGDLRVQDAWTFDSDVQQIAANSQILDLLSKLYGRRAFPFQTLNFPVGTQQALHSDSIHFSSIPERFMCGVWLAFEDVDREAGPLVYLPGSHKWPILSNIALGRRGAENRGMPAQEPFDRAWRALVDASGLQAEQFLPRKGQALIWAANLLHGGAQQLNPTLTRWSQVTHYFFEDCVYFTPAFSDEGLGELDIRSITNVTTGATERNLYMGNEIGTPPTPSPSIPRRRFWLGFGHKRGAFDLSDLPSDFDAAEYYRLNTDVAAHGHDAAEHYLAHGRDEGRRYRTS